MTDRMAAARYARALFDVALAETDPQAVGRDLTALADLIREHSALQKVLTNPAVPASSRQALIAELIARGGGLAGVVARLARLLAARDRLSLLPAVAEAYRQRLMEHRNVVQGEVITAVPLPAERRQALEKSLAAATGKRVSLVTRVDPALGGGAVTRIGSLVFDGSIARQLERLEESLAEGSS